MRMRDCATHTHQQILGTPPAAHLPAAPREFSSAVVLAVTRCAAAPVLAPLAAVFPRCFARHHPAPPHIPRAAKFGAKLPRRARERFLPRTAR